MFLREIEIENFGIIRQAHLLFPESNPVVGVVGRYEAEEDSGRSNRAGKSTFVDALEYLLFGKARTRHHGKLINRTARAAGEGMLVRGVYVLQDGQEIEIIRRRSNDGKGTASVTGFEGSGWAEVNERIAELISWSHDEYKNTGHFAQGDIHAFMKSTPKEKRSLLLDWLDQTRWEVRADFAKQRAGEADNKVRQLTGTLNALPEPEGDPEDLEAQAEEAEDAADITRGEIKTAEEKLEALKAEYREVTEAAQAKVERSRLTEEVKRIEAALEEAETNAEKKSQLEAKVRAQRATLRDLRRKHDSELSGAQAGTMAIRDDRNKARDRWQAARKTGGVCPVLNEPCGRIEPEQTEGLKEAARQTQDAYEAAQAAYKKTKTRQDGEVRESESVLEALESDLRGLGNADTQGLEEILDRLDGQLEAVNGRIPEGGRDAAQINADKMDAGEEIKRLNRALGQYEAEARGYREAAQRARDYAERKERIEASLEAARQDLGAWHYCAFMFGDRGIPNEFIKGAFETLESDINYILGRMNCGLSVEFRPYRETKNLEPSCLACGREFKPRERKCSDCSEPRQRKRVEQLVLVIHDAAEETQSDFSLDSGGGQTLISFAVRLALLFFKVRQGNGEVPPIVLDEIAGMLDPVNRQAVIDVILHILTVEYGIKQIFWISHNEEILDLIENAVAVTRAGAASTVDWI